MSTQFRLKHEMEGDSRPRPLDAAEGKSREVPIAEADPPRTTVNGPTVDYITLARALADIANRNRWGVLAGAAFIALLFCSYNLIIGPKYSATAIIQIDTVRDDSRELSFPTPDAAAIVETQVGLLQSEGLARSLADRLEAKEFPPRGWLGTALQNYFPDEPEIAARKEYDRRIGYLQENLKIESDRRNYLVKVSFVSPTSEHASRIANAFASSYIFNREIQRLADLKATAQRAYREQSAMLGERHPQVLSASSRLEAAQSALQNAESRNFILTPQELREKGRVMPAEPTTRSAGPGPLSALALGGIVGLITMLILVFLQNRHLVRAAIAEAVRR